jgi:putative response regulator receiver domain protein
MVYKILIAEDEQIELEYLRKLIERNFPQIEKVITASNGQEAVDMFLMEEPDLVLIDINMPIKNGLAALKEMRNNSKKPFVSIVLTSYSDFSFAQEGIHLQVSDYILKPAQDSKIRESISTALEKLQNQYNFHSSVHSLISHSKKVQSILEPELVFAIVNRADELTIQRYFETFEGKVFQYAVCLLVEKSVDKDILLKIKNICIDSGYSCFMAELLDSYVYYLFFPSPIQIQDIKRIEYAVINEIGKIKIVWGSPKDNISKFYMSFDEAYTQLKEGTKKLENTDDHYFIKEQVEKLISTLDDNSSSIVIYELALSLLKETTERRNYLFREIVEGLYTFSKNNHINTVKEKEWNDVFVTTNSFQEIIYITTQNLIEILKPIKHYLMSNHSYIYQKAIDFIRENYKKPIGLSDLGNALDVTPNYISRVISKEGKKGERTFVDLITTYRINEAKKLIQEGITIKDISYQVGFHSTSYFSKCFKKKTGFSPKEYQDKMNGK